MNYVDQFFRWNCKDDIMKAVPNFGSKPMKEITEAMAIRNMVSEIVIKEKNKMKYSIIDLCAGVGLAGIFCVYTLPVMEVIGIDKQKRIKNDYLKIKRYGFFEINIYNNSFINISIPTILVSVHPCKKLAEKVIDIYCENDNIEYLFLMPCCGGGDVHDSFIENKLGKYVDWCYYLKERIINNSKSIIKIKEDIKIMSPKNIIISARKEKIKI